MKTIHLWCSVIFITLLTLCFAQLKPPQPKAVAQASHVEAVQQPEKAKLVSVPSTPESTVKPAEIKPSEEIKPVVEAQAPQPEPLTNHQEIMQAAGIAEGDWPAAEDIIAKESGWCATKWEGEYGYCPDAHGVPESGGYGLCQATPASKMASEDAAWITDPVKQMRWCDQYAQAYGGWWAAKEFRDCLGACYSSRTNNYQYKGTTWW